MMLLGILEDDPHSTSTHILLCHRCQRVVTQFPGIRRNVCPFCGHMYPPQPQLVQTGISAVHLPQVTMVSATATTSNRTGSRQRQRRGPLGGSISRFFSGLRPTKAKSEQKRQTRDDSSLNEEDYSRTSSRLERSESEDSILPPLDTMKGPLLRVNLRRLDSAGNLVCQETIIQRRSNVGGQLKRHTMAASSFRSTSGLDSCSKTIQSGPTATEQHDVTCPEELEKAFELAKYRDDFSNIINYYNSAFNSFADINATFKQSEHSQYYSSGISSGIKLNLVEAAYEKLMTAPQCVQRSALKAIINSLLGDTRGSNVVMMKPVCRDDLRAYFILSQNPQFRRVSTYVIYAHLLRQIASLCDHDQQILSTWYSELSPKAFKCVIESAKQLISIRLFPPRPQDLPPTSKSSWWIPCASRLLAILYDANNSRSPLLVPFSEFYTSSLDHWELLQDYSTWEDPTNDCFSFCHYPFLLSITAKRSIVEGHTAHQMIATARDSIIGNLLSNRAPDMDMLFLNITVSRNNLLIDSLDQLSNKQENLRKKLRVRFTDEPGLDMGGLTKEWFQLLVKEVFKPECGLFCYQSSSDTYWFSSTATDDESLREFHLVGILMGLAVYNGVILDIRFPQCCYKKLLSPAVLPRVLDLDDTQLGIIEASLTDLAQLMPETARGLTATLNYDGNVEEDVCISFQVSLQEFGNVVIADLKENGSEVPVTNETREGEIIM